MTALAEAQVRTEDEMARLAGTVNRLGNIAISHEDRLDRLEGQ
jgi:hypothetical protein